MTACLPSPAPLNKLFRDIRRGAGGSFRTFISKFESSLGWLVGKEAEKAIIFLGSLATYGISQMPKQPSDQPDFVRTLVKTSGIWKAVFLLMTRAVEDDRQGRPWSLSLYLSTLRVFSSCLDNYMGFFPDEGPIFVRTLIRAGMFDALDVALPHFALRTDVACMLTNPAFTSFVLSSVKDH